MLDTPLAAAGDPVLEFGDSVLATTDGTKPLGPIRARIDLDANGLISPRDRVDLSFSATPLDPEELAFFSARYSIVINDRGAKVGAFGSYSRTEPGAYLANRELLGESWQGGIRIRQLSTAPLLIGESFSLGGTQFLRGYDFAQAVGDEGAAGLAELRYDWPRALGAVRNVQLYAFADAGTVTSLAAGRGSETLASSGAGLRTDITRDLDLDFEIAVPLTEDRYDTGDKTPRINIRVSQSF